MDQLGTEARNVFTAIHHQATGELLRLMDGFYSNIEDGLFELAYRDPDEAKQRSCFNTMREMRYRRGSLIQLFAKRMQRRADAWFDPNEAGGRASEDAEKLARGMASKCVDHFGGVLQSIAERAAYGTGKDTSLADLPIGPHQVSLAFVQSCRSLQFDRDAIELVKELFVRFVLDRLGTMYGQINLQLEDAGFLAISEISISGQISA